MAQYLSGLLKNTYNFVQVRILGEHTDHEPEEIEKTISRPKYFDPYKAVEYGIIDRVRTLPLA